MSETLGPSPDDMNARQKEGASKETDVISTENLPPPLKSTAFPGVAEIEETDQRLIEQKKRRIRRGLSGRSRTSPARLFSYDRTPNGNKR